MSKAIINQNISEHQLIFLGLDLAYKVLAIEDCNEALAYNPHIIKICEAAKNFNELVIEFLFASHKEGN
jgi:hypothetical protein